MWLRTKHPGIEYRHESACRSNQGGKCRCERSYRARYKNADGKWRWSQTFKSLDEAVEFRSQPVQQKVFKRSKVFNDLVDEWFELARKGAITKKGGQAFSPRTLTAYGYCYKNHARDDIGKRDSASLTVQDWQLWLDGLVRDGLKRNSVSVTLNCIRSVYRWACSPRRMLLPVNAVRGLELPAHDEEKRDRVATPDECKALLAVLKNGDKTSFALALYAGLRNCEREPLEWSDVDFERNRIRIRVSKSKAGIRTVPLIAPLRTILLAEHMRQGRSDGLVCRGPKGGSPELISLRNRAFKAWEAAGLEPIGLHEARHSFCTAMALAGVPIKSLHELAGHTDIKTTIETYGHLYAGHEDQAGRLLDAFFVPQSSAVTQSHDPRGENSAETQA